MGRTKELFLEEQQRAFESQDRDCSGNLYEEWLREEPNLGAEHSVFIANKDREDAN